ncbi:MAG: GntR family transcriptional regulator [Lentisphaerae bacterium]|nr:GntR family transcriptional regulator [Lentisphaerota bacterium]
MNRQAIPAKLSVELGSRLVEDIRRRKLEPGARYYTTAEVSRRFKVSLQTAASAMARLAERDILVRLRKRGTFIGPAPAVPEDASAAAPRPQIILLMRPVAPGGYIPSFVGLPIFLNRAMPDAVVHTYVVEKGEDVDVLKQAVTLLPFGAPLIGVVTGDRERPLYETLHALQVPAVVCGTLEPGVPDLPTVGLDYEEAGQTLARCLIRRGHKRIVLQLAGASERDHVFADSIAASFTEAGLPATALRVRTYGNDAPVAAAALTQMFREKNRPTAVISRGPTLAQIAHGAAEAAGLRVGRNVDIAWADESWQVETQPYYIYIEPLITGDELARRIVGMLEDQRAGRRLRRRHFKVPTRLHEPER